jgi:hypothetical protein
MKKLHRQKKRETGKLSRMPEIKLVFPKPEVLQSHHYGTRELVD